MATAQTLINRSLRMLGVLASGESPTANETADALVALNAMLEGWRNDKLLVYTLADQPVTLINGTATYTIGPTGGTVATSPVDVESAYVRKSNIDYPLIKYSDAEYQDVAQKNVTADIPSHFLFNRTHPNATVTVYPVPTQGNVMHLRVRTALPNALAAGDTISLPSGYEDAIAYNLAVNLHPEFPGIPLNQVIVERAKTTLSGLKRINSTVPKMVAQWAKGGRRYNILSDA